MARDMTWRKRWCLLRDTSLGYYKSDNDTNPVGTIFAEDILEVKELEVATTNEESQKDKTHGHLFEVHCRNGNYQFIATTVEARNEWVSNLRSLLINKTTMGDVVTGDLVQYCTVESILGRGIRVSGPDINTVLLAQLSVGANKKSNDNRGWFADVFVPQSVILNLFSQHQWQLVNMFHTTSIVPGNREPVLSDMIIFSKSVKLG
ncbi:uncharacterized protein [Dysidea avara]|uniref:uncharacterized protein isoform X2 n=1 Tax=Dysidea avara TaxID=196820 RepID=UPI003327787B